jgi:hypothetical protein
LKRLLLFSIHPVPKSVIPIFAVARHRLKFATRITIRDGCLFILSFQKLNRNDQRFHRVTRVATAGCNGLISCRLKPVSIGL